MLTNFEVQEAQGLKESIEQSLHNFIFNPALAKDIDRLNFLQEQCDHRFEDGVCIYCGLETIK
jgi:hypothetical protein